MDSSGLVLVTGATGAQGGATARRLLARGRRVRFLARDPYSPAARALAASGAQAAQGDLGDAASIAAAVQGVAAVFSVQVPDVTGNDHERRHGFALVQAARAAGVSQFVHTSVGPSSFRVEPNTHNWWLVVEPGGHVGRLHLSLSICPPGCSRGS